MRPRLLDLPHGHQAIVDEADWPAVEHLTLYRGNNGYVYYSTWENGKSTPRTLHSLLVTSRLGPVPAKSHIDHVNGDKLDNRRENLRIVTPGQNQVNRHGLNRNNGSGVRGVTVRKSGPKPYIAQIMVNHRMVYLGSFATLEEAAEARRQGEIDHYGTVCP